MAGSFFSSSRLCYLDRLGQYQLAIAEFLPLTNLGSRQGPAAYTDPLRFAHHNAGTIAITIWVVIKAGIISECAVRDVCHFERQATDILADIVSTDGALAITICDA